MFEQKGVVRLEGEINEEELLEASVEGGAETYEMNDDPGAEVFTEATHLEQLNQALLEQGFPVKEAELRWLANNYVELSDPEQAVALLKLMDTLEELDDVQNVTANFDMADDLIFENSK
jgi:transcriptional/translational regulatory protein YebC/TACO1